jgi:hypothetical protein
MLMIARVVDVFAGLISLGLVVNRYRGRQVRVVPGDIMLWTLSIFFIAPLFLDAMQFVTSYQLFPEFGVAAKDPLVSVIAATAVVIAVWIVTRAVRLSAVTAPSLRSNLRLSARVRSFWLVLTLAPLVAVAASPDPGIYRTFAASFSLRSVGQPFDSHELIATPLTLFQPYVTGATYVSAVALGMWLYTRKSWRAFLIVPPVTLLDFWLEGKRNILALIAILVLFVLVSSKGALSRKKARHAMVMAAVLFGGVFAVSQAFQSHYRAVVISNNRSHEVLKVDFGRTDVLRLAIAGQISPGVPRPLEYPGQSLVLDAEQVLDRLTHHKPISYEDRVQSITQDEPLQITKGKVTTSILSEAIDNFGLLGILVGPWILALIVRAGGRRVDPLLSLLICLFGSLIIVTNVVAASPIVVLVVLRGVWVFIKGGRTIGARLNSYPSEAPSTIDDQREVVGSTPFPHI